MSKKKENKKRSSKNLKITTRIVMTSVLGIVLPLIIISTFSTVFVNTIASYFNFASVTTNSYSTVNQLQWSQTLSTITDELTGDDSENKKLEKIRDFVEPLEQVNSLIYIEKNGVPFYSTQNGSKIIELANNLVNIEDGKNLNYFGDGGLVIVNHAEKGDAKYRIVIVNEDYTVNNSDKKINAQSFTKVLLSRTGLIVLIIVLLFVISIGVISVITSQTIVKPVKKIARGAEEIAKGNLDYEIDYDSTNELGQTVDSFNNMRLRLKKSLQTQQEAQEAKQAVVAGIAHDLRTPLTSVKGYAEGLRDGIANTPEKQRQYVDIICESINNTEKILDDLLTISKLELGGLELETAPVNARELFDDAAADIKRSLETVDFDFTYACHCGADTVICVDTDRFARVISNIISNSVKYARPDIKGSIYMALNEYERSVILEISDNGIGVDKQNLTKIFDVMYRTDPARTKVSDGSGLGLSVCRQIVELHGGTIWATGRKGNGLSIFISLPKRVTENEENSDN